MTKKAKKKSVKTGSREKNGPKVTTFNISSNPTYTGKFSVSTAEETCQDCVNKRDVKIKKLRKHEQKQLKLKQLQEEKEQYDYINNLRNIYPLDLWFLLAKFIQPEQIQVFACICKGTYLVTLTKKFWINCYRRYVVNSTSLPVHLKPQTILTAVGLKTRVVRAFYFGYEALKSRIDSRAPILENPSNIENNVCQTFWWRQAYSNKRRIKIHVCYFKLAPPKSIKNEKNIFNKSLQISCNTEADFVILRVVSPSYTHIPNPSGLCLTSVNVGVSRDFLHHKVRLLFHEYRSHGNYSNAHALTAVIEPVFDIQALNWWHPEYPHPFDH